MLLGAAVLALGSPVLADHMGPSGFGAGGGISVFSPETMDGRHWGAAFRITYTRPDQRSDEELQTLAEHGIAAHNTDYSLNAGLGVAYGLNHHLTLSAELPYVRRDHLREGDEIGVEQLGTVEGIGDLNLLAKYRLTDGQDLGLALVGGIKVPTGSTHKTANGERLETEHQPGTGSWDPIFGASASAKLGIMRLTASALYQLATTGAENTRLGNRLQGGVALSHRFGRAEQEPAESRNHHHGDELDEHHEHAHSSWDALIEVAGEWEGRQKIDGEVEQASGGKWAWIAPGLRFNAATGWSASAGIAVPFWQQIRPSHPDNRYRVTLSLGRTF
ncbi:hypothetical protein GCM10022276_03130 [Sphingomonas limnosediminicola]|uniref:Transporter n=1 Tax=Sphingomonas limnosediminicola TaxID=940133 RepID=A0ABP7KUQ3_9SPHN